VVNFEFSAPGKILFGPGRSAEAATEIVGWGRRILLVTGSRPERAAPLREALLLGGAELREISLSREPHVEDLASGLEVARTFQAQAVVGLGGGSVLDLGKAIAALAPCGSDPMDHLEVVGKGLPLRGPGLPFAAVPTTAGTGAEATRNAVLSTGTVKVSLRGPQLMPRLAVVDPSYAVGAPRDLTAWTGMDALTQLVEPLLSRFANPLTDAICRQGIPLSVRALPAALRDPLDLSARSDLALASLFSGMALANARLGAVHGLAAPLGGMFPCPHGAVCARLLVPAWKANVAALERSGDSVRERFLDASRVLTGRRDATLADGLRVLEAMAEKALAPPLSRWGMTETDIPSVREAGMRASSMRGNPVELSPVEIEAILLEAL
jgi:alcohol dehydrogenase class IV